MDFAVLPPEINSGRMYAGAGSGPIMAAAATWDRLAAQLSAAAGSYQTVIWELTDGPWRGPASASMAAAAKPYVEWMHTTAARAEQTANQARAAAAAYEQAFAAIVPPSAVAANRAALTSLTATNTFGQNTAAIAANQAEYAEMWAQDVAAMHDYTAGSAAAATLPPFAAPPQSTDPAGAGTQAGVVAQNTAPGAVATAQTALASAAQSNPLLDFLNSDPIQALETFYTGTTGFWQLFGTTTLQGAGSLLSMDMGIPAAIFGSQAFAGVTGLVPALASSSVSEGASQSTLAGSSGPGIGASGSPGVVGSGVSAGLGRAAPAGGLSVPPSWGPTSAGIRLAAAAVPASGSAGFAVLPESETMGTPGGRLDGIPPLASVVNAPTSGESRARAGSDLKVIPRLARAAAADETAQYRRAPHRGAPYPANAPDEHENRELEELRKLVAELTERREAATHLVREAIET